MHIYIYIYTYSFIYIYIYVCNYDDYFYCPLLSDQAAEPVLAPAIAPKAEAAGEAAAKAAATPTLRRPKGNPQAGQYNTPIGP